MQLYRKKPVEVFAIQYTGENAKEVIASIGRGHAEDAWAVGVRGLRIFTLEGVMWANPNDWIICGVKGEIYPCKPDIFKETYEKVEAKYDFAGPT